ncbi:MAG: hypothetical protein ACKESB_02865 [Candidatus Hodgkinia cicadicola]
MHLSRRLPQPLAVLRPLRVTSQSKLVYSAVGPEGKGKRATVRKVVLDERGAKVLS